ncbi:hypothetical protein BC940DRAFT_294225 [Gongronella butleri]|nr:hypothetical protein BC940DRAFT_294225 [Gongronella butleri]
MHFISFSSFFCSTFFHDFVATSLSRTPPLLKKKDCQKAISHTMTGIPPRMLDIPSSSNQALSVCTNMLPDTLQASVLVRRIGLQEGWTSDLIAQSIHQLNDQRLYKVRDLIALSNESWEVIALLPQVKKVLRSALAKDWLPSGQTSSGAAEAAATKRRKKKTKKKKNINMTPLTNESWLAMTTSPVDVYAPPSSDLWPDPAVAMGDVICDDPLTIQNTLRNLSLSFDGEWPEPSTSTSASTTPSNSPRFAKRHKSVRFQDRHSIIFDHHASSSSSSSASSCSSASPPAMLSPVLPRALPMAPPMPQTSLSTPIHPTTYADEEALMTAAAAAMVVRRSGSTRREPQRASSVHPPIATR